MVLTLMMMPILVVRLVLMLVLKLIQLLILLAMELTMQGGLCRRVALILRQMNGFM
jgi:hypothetical protein